MSNHQEDDFTVRYVALWNEPDAARRRAAIESLWAPDGSNYTPSIEAVGYDEIEARVARSYDKFVGPGTHRFRLGMPAAAHHNVVKVQWDMVEVATGAVASAGLEFLVLDADGRIHSDHQFVLS
jgi:hypothetical protein